MLGNLMVLLKLSYRLCQGRDVLIWSGSLLPSESTRKKALGKSETFSFTFVVPGLLKKKKKNKKTNSNAVPYMEKSVLWRNTEK